MNKKHSIRWVIRRTLKTVEELISTVLTWVSFVLLLPSLMFAAYYTFVVFDPLKVIAGLALVVVSVYANKSL